MVRSVDRMARKFHPSLPADTEIAASWHSDNKGERAATTLRDVPVLVICHRAYEIALDMLGAGSTIPGTWETLHSFRDSTRKLVVIDESLDILDEAQVHEKGIYNLLSKMPASVEREFPLEVQNLRELPMMFNQLKGLADTSGTSDRVLIKEPFADRNAAALKGITVPDFDQLRAALRSVKLAPHDPRENRKLHREFEDTLRSLSAIIKGWSWFRKSDGQNTLNTARILVPESACSSVVMDATASSNLMYTIFDKIDVLTPVAGSRRYENVELHVSMGHRVGKRNMIENATDLSERLISDLKDRIGGSKALIVTHKDVESYLVGLDPETFTFETCHWGGLDGSNQWRECNTLVVFGLPYRKDTWAKNAFQACQGVQDNEWLGPEGDRSFQGYPNITQSLTAGQIASDVIQALGRGCCRKVSDEHGGCPRMVAYLLLPAYGKLGKEILAAIEKAMEGITVKKWDYTGAKKALRKTKHEEAVTLFLTQNMRPGRIAVSTVKKELKLKKSSLDVLIDRLKAREPGDSFVEALDAAKVTYITERAGKTTRAYFNKE
jgi:hypothetical protein